MMNMDTAKERNEKMEKMNIKYREKLDKLLSADRKVADADAKAKAKAEYEPKKSKNMDDDSKYMHT